MQRIPTKETHFKKQIGSVSFEATDLVRLLENHSTDSIVHAESNGYRFTGLDDINSNISSFAGRPHIWNDFFSIRFDDYRGCVIESKDTSEESISKALSIYNEISLYRDLFDIWFDERLNVSVLGGIIIGGVCGYYLSIKTEFNDLFISALVFIIVSVSSGQVIHRIQNIVLRRKLLPVRHSPMEGFFNRYRELIAVGVVGPVVASIITFMMTKYFIEK